MLAGAGSDAEAVRAGYGSDGRGDRRWAWMVRPTRVEWAALAAALVLTVQYAWLVDDAFVYFRFADNALFAHRGLVYNDSEFVEGFSSPLWMLTLLALRSTGIGWWLAVRLLGVLSCAAFWALLVQLGRAASPRGVAVVSLPLLLLAPNYAVLSYHTSGLETPFVQVMAGVYALALLRPHSRGLQWLAGLAPMVRHELAVPWVLLAGWCGWRTRRIPWPLLLSAGLSVGPWLAFRVWYYAELLPNTFYLKYVWLARQGLVYLADAVTPYGLHWVLGAGAVGFAVLGWRNRSARRRGDSPPELLLAERAVMLACAASVAVFVIRIGGDPRHYRYLAFPICLAVAATAGLPEHLLARIQWRPRDGLVAVTALLVMGWVATRYPHQLVRHPLLATLDEGIPIAPKSGTRGKGAVLINDPAAHRHHDDLACPPWRGCSKIDEHEAYQAAAVLPGRPAHGGVVADYWCAGIYHRVDERAVHSLGLTDPFLARTRMAHDRPAHKWGLVPLARDIARLERVEGNRLEVGMFRRALEAGIAPPWVAGNLESLEVIEHKARNQHHLIENLRLALSFPAKIDPKRQPPVG